MAQAKGSKARLIGYKEAVFGTIPGVPHALIFPINTSDLKASRNLTTAKTIRGRRDAVAPIQGNVDAGGQIEIPVDVRALGWWLLSAIGVPVTTQDPTKALNNGAAAVNVGGGVVGLPCTAHGYYAGEEIVIANTTNYNGTEAVLPTSTVDLIHITAPYVAENMGPTSTARVKRYSHVFKVLDADLYSYVFEQQYRDIGVYQAFSGCKTNKFDIKFGGDGELVATLDVLAADEAVGVASFDAAPTAISFKRFGNFQAAIKKAGVTFADVKELSLSINNNLDGDTFCIGGGGKRGALNEGLCAVNGSMSAIFKDAALYTEAVAGTESALEVILTNGAHSLSLNVPELLYKRQSPGIKTPGGIWIEMPYEGYFDDAPSDSIIVATLVNDVASYVWA